MKTLLSAILITLIISLQGQNPQWTWRYEKVYTAQEQKNLHNHHETVFSQSATQPFEQLMLSWNALRPTRGYYRFEVQVKQKKHWSKWMKFAEWGHRVQRSLADSDAGGANNHYVRVELGSKKATAFKIRVRSMNGADLTDLHSLMVTISDKSLFASQAYAHTIKHLKPVHVKNVPPYTQMIEEFEDHRSICSPTSIAMIMSHWTKQVYDPTEFCSTCFDHGLQMYGSWPFSVAAAYDETDGEVKCHVTRLQSVHELYSLLKRGLPVCVSIRGNSLVKEQPDHCTRRGHLLVVTGIDPRRGHVYVNDPAFKNIDDVPHRYSLKGFLEAWEASHRLAYVSCPA